MPDFATAIFLKCRFLKVRDSWKCLNFDSVRSLEVPDVAKCLIFESARFAESARLFKVPDLWKCLYFWTHVLKMPDCWRCHILKAPDSRQCKVFEKMCFLMKIPDFWKCPIFECARCMTRPDLLNARFEKFRQAVGPENAFLIFKVSPSCRARKGSCYFQRFAIVSCHNCSYDLQSVVILACQKR